MANTANEMHLYEEKDRIYSMFSEIAASLREAFFVPEGKVDAQSSGIGIGAHQRSRFVVLDICVSIRLMTPLREPILEVGPAVSRTLRTAKSSYRLRMWR